MIDTLTSLGLATGVARSATIYALVSATHILGIALLVGAILLVDLRLMGRLGGLDDQALTILRATAAIGLVLAIVAGMLLLTARPAEYLTNRVVLAKLALVAVGIVHALWFEARVRRVGLATLVRKRSTVAHGAVSLATWLGVLLLGRWIAFV